MQTDLPRNLLLHMNPDARERIVSFPRSGQKRVDQLFQEVQGQIVGRQTELTVGQQDDAPKRARDALGLPAPVKGEWIAARLASIPFS